MSSKLTIFLLSIALVSLLVLSGCKGKLVDGTKVDLTTPPPLPEEGGAEEEEQPPAPPAAPSSAGKGSAPGQQPQGLPLLG